MDDALASKPSHFPHQVRVDERLVHDAGVSMSWRQIFDAISGHERKRHLTIRQNIGDFIDAAAGEIDVKQSRVEIFRARQKSRLIQRPDWPDDFMSAVAQYVIEMGRDEELIFYNQDSRH